MSNSEEENSADQSSDLGIDDEQLPEDLQPGDDNPLAEGLDDGETVDDLLDGGKTPDQQEQPEEPDDEGEGSTDSEGTGSSGES